MGKGDKKTKRGKIVIGSYGVRRARKNKRNIVAAAPVPPPPVEEKPKKTVKKAEPPVAEAEAKPKAPRSRKKAAEGDAG